MKFPVFPKMAVIFPNLNYPCPCTKLHQECSVCIIQQKHFDSLPHIPGLECRFHQTFLGLWHGWALDTEQIWGMMTSFSPSKYPKNSKKSKAWISENKNFEISNYMNFFFCSSFTLWTSPITYSVHTLNCPATVCFRFRPPAWLPAGGGFCW